MERLGENLNVNYQTEDLLRIANNSSVDGIIFCGEDNEGTVELINEAVRRGIAVVSLRQDIEDSERQCFVGVNSYDLGLEYGKQILELVEQEGMQNPRICILADNTMSESKQNLITFAIRDCFSEVWQGEENLPEMEIRKIDTSDAFSAEEAIRDIFMDSQNLPDIMVCLNSVYTQEMGSQCIRALTEYHESGYTSSYVPISTQVIGSAEARKLLQEAEVEDAGD